MDSVSQIRSQFSVIIIVTVKHYMYSDWQALIWYHVTLEMAQKCCESEWVGQHTHFILTVGRIWYIHVYIASCYVSGILALINMSVCMHISVPHRFQPCNMTIKLASSKMLAMSLFNFNLIATVIHQVMAVARSLPTSAVLVLLPDFGMVRIHAPYQGSGNGTRSCDLLYSSTFDTMHR